MTIEQTVVWTGGDPDLMAEQGVIGDPIPNGEHYGDEEPADAGEEEWA